MGETIAYLCTLVALAVCWVWLQRYVSE